MKVDKAKEMCQNRRMWKSAAAYPDRGKIYKLKSNTISKPPRIVVTKPTFQKVKQKYLPYST